MKTTRFLISIVTLGAFTLGLVFAGEPSNKAPGSQARTINDGSSAARHGDEGPASARTSHSSGTKATAKAHSGPKLPQPFQANGGHPGDKRANSAQTKGASAYAAGLHPPGLNKAAGGAKVVSMTMASQMENQHRLSLAGLSGTPAPHQVVHPLALRTASLGGAASWSAGNTAAINGTGMKHRL
jgi:hypothetical protein